jgi:hypothetical protein
MAYTFLAASGEEVGNSFVESDRFVLARELLADAQHRHVPLVLPSDHVVAPSPGRLPDAMRGIIASLRMAPADLDMRNTKAIICAELGYLKCAHDEWALLLQVAPNYAPARTNLAILMGSTPALPPSPPNTVEIPPLGSSESWTEVFALQNR